MAFATKSVNTFNFIKMKKSILIDGAPFFVSAFYSSTSEPFFVGEELKITNSRGHFCHRKIRAIFDQGNGVALIDLI